MSNGAFQLQIDGNLAQKATEIFSRLGLDLQSAVQLFLNRSVEARGVPFPMRLPDPGRNKRYEAVELMKSISRDAEEAGVADMTLEEINAEIEAVRRGQR